MSSRSFLYKGWDDTAAGVRRRPDAPEGLIVTEIGTSTDEFVVTLPGAEGDGGPGAQLRLSWGAATDTGHRRSANEDSYIARWPIFAVADGMGGHSAGDLASAAVVTRLDEQIPDGFSGQEVVDTALGLATDDIDEISIGRELGVGTTVTGAVVTLHAGDAYFSVFNIGDSRVYQFDHNELRQVSIDHSLVQEMVDAGLIDREQAENHPESNVITRAVGFGAPPVADYWMLPVDVGSRLLVCSDGLTKELSDERIRVHLAAGLPARQTADDLVAEALAAGGRDNVTTIVLDVVGYMRDSAGESSGKTIDESTSPRSGVPAA